jgi:hypothetical protein
MLPYGFKPGDCRADDGGPTTKHRKIKSKNRQECRRLYAKKARAALRQQLLKGTND